MDQEKMREELALLVVELFFGFYQDTGVAYSDAAATELVDKILAIVNNRGGY